MHIHHHLLSSTLCLLLVACTPVSELASEEEIRALVGGSWTVMTDKYHNVTLLPQPAVITFDVASPSITGFDGCNEFKGRYVVEHAILRGTISSTTAYSCRNAAANQVRRTLHALLRDGTVTSLVSTRRIHMLILQNSNTWHELRLARMIDARELSSH